MKVLVSLAGLVALTAMIPVCIEAYSWGEWTSCSKTCGGGTRFRTSKCKHPHNRCRKEKEPCNQQACNVNGTSGPNVTSRTPEANDTVGPSPTSEGVNVTSGTPEPNGTVRPSPTSEGLNVTSGTPEVKDTVGPSPTSEGLNVTSGTPEANGTVGPSPTSEVLNVTSGTPESKDTVGPSPTSEAPPPQTKTDGDITEGKETDEFLGSGTMDREFSDDLRNTKSQEHKQLKNDCETRLKETYKSEESVLKTWVEKFTPGSVVMHFRVKTLRSRRASSSRLQSIFALSVRSGAMKDLGISSFGLSKMKQLDEGSKANMENESNIIDDSWQFFLYGFGVMIALAIIFVLLAVIKIKFMPSSQDNLNEDIDDGDSGFERKFSFPGKDKISELEDNNKFEKEGDDLKMFHY